MVSLCFPWGVVAAAWASESSSSAGEDVSFLCVVVDRG